MLIDFASFFAAADADTTAANVSIPFPESYTLDLVPRPGGGMEVRAVLRYADRNGAETLAARLGDHMMARLGNPGTFGEVFG